MFLSLLLLLLLHTVIAVVSVVAVVSAIAVVAFVTAVAVVVAVVHTVAVAAAGPLVPVLLWWLAVVVAAAACAVVFVFGSLVFTVVTVLVGLWVTRATVKWVSRVSRELRSWGLRIFYLLPRSVGPKSSLRVKCFLPKSRRSQGIATHFACSAMLGISFRCGVKWSLSGDSCP